MRKNVLWISLVLAWCGASGRPSSLDLAKTLTSSFWMSVDAPWKRPPAYTENPSRYAPVHILRFSPDGRFAMIACWVNEYRGKYHISPGDGQAVFTGEWRAVSAQTAEVRYQLVSETVRRPSIKYPTPPEKHILTYATANDTIELREGNWHSVPVTGVSKKEFAEYLPEGNESRK